MADAFRAVLLGVPYTVLVTATALLIGAALGVPLALGRSTRIPPVRWLCRALIDVVRGIPPIVWLFIIFFGVGTEYIRLDSLDAGILGLGLIASGYMAEIYRGGLLSVGPGQWEAASALGMRGSSLMTYVVGPQALRSSLPAASTYAIGLLKDSSVVSTIGVAEVTFEATALSRATGAGLSPFIAAAVVYIVLGAPLAYAARKMDARLRRRVER